MRPHNPIQYTPHRPSRNAEMGRYAGRSFAIRPASPDLQDVGLDKFRDWVFRPEKPPAAIHPVIRVLLRRTGVDVRRVDADSRIACVAGQQFRWKFFAVRELPAKPGGVSAVEDPVPFRRPARPWPAFIRAALIDKAPESNFWRNSPSNVSAWSRAILGKAISPTAINPPAGTENLTANQATGIWKSSWASHIHRLYHRLSNQ